MQFTIYALAHPETKEVRYVGITQRSLKERMSRHLCNAKRNRKTPVACWIWSLLQKSLEPLVLVLERTDKEDREVYWIVTYRKAGIRLLNLTDGDESATKHTRSPETRAKISAIRKGQKLGPMSEETKEKIGRANKGKKRTPETIAKMHWTRTPEYKQKISEAQLHSPKRFRTPEQVEKHPETKLTQAQVIEIRKRYAAGGIKFEELAPEYGINIRHITEILHFRVWHSLGTEYQDQIREQAKKNQSESRRHTNKLTKEMVYEIHRRATLGEPTKVIADEFSITSVHVWKIRSEKVWKHLWNISD